MDIQHVAAGASTPLYYVSCDGLVLPHSMSPGGGGRTETQHVLQSSPLSVSVQNYRLKPAQTTEAPLSAATCRLFIIGGVGELSGGAAARVAHSAKLPPQSSASSASVA